MTKHRRVSLVIGLGGLVASLLPGGVAQAAGGTQPSSSSGACSTVMIYASRTSGAPKGSTGGSAAEISAIRSRLADRAASTGRTINVAVVNNPYPATAPSAGFDAYRRSVDDGASRLVDWVTRTAAQCPKADLILIGHSQGAEVVHEGLVGLGTTSSRRKALLAVEASLLLADPTRVVSDPSLTYLNVAGQARGNGILVGVDGPPTKIPAQVKGDAITACHDQDDICSMDPSNDSSQPSAPDPHNAPYKGGVTTNQLAKFATDRVALR